METICPRFDMAEQDSNPDSVSRESEALPLPHSGLTVSQADCDVTFWFYFLYTNFGSCRNTDLLIVRFVSEISV